MHFEKKSKSGINYGKDSRLFMFFLFVGDNQSNGDDFSLSDCFCFMYKSLLMIGGTTAPQKISGRITFISVITGSMLFYYLWEAMLISYFSTAKTVLPFNSLEELLTKSDKKVRCKVNIIEQAIKIYFSLIFK